MKNIIFDFGGVLVDWNPRYLYKNHFDKEEDMEFFLRYICADSWNLEQDRGRSFAKGVSRLQDEFPEYHDLIALYFDRWEEMLNGEIEGTVDILRKLKGKYNLYGLTNWSAETIGIAFDKYDFFKEFEGKIVISGVEKVAKPDPKIYQILFERYAISPNESLFIDDNQKNIDTAKTLGLNTILFENPTQLYEELTGLGIQI